MKTKKSVYLIPAAATAAGALLFVLSRLFEAGTLVNRLMFAAGVAAFILGLGSLISKAITAKVSTPESEHAMKIEENDERNILIRERAGWAVSRVMTTVLCVCAMVSAFANLELYITLALAGLVVLQGVLTVAFQMYYEKRV